MVDAVPVSSFGPLDEGREVQDTYGGMSTQTLNVLLRTREIHETSPEVGDPVRRLRRAGRATARRPPSG